MATQQYIYVDVFENRPPMPGKGNYIQCLSYLIRYASSKPNGKLLAKPFSKVEAKQIEDNNQAILLERLAKTQDPLALFAKDTLVFFANTPHKSYPLPLYTPKEPLPTNDNFMQQPTPTPVIDDIIHMNDPLAAINREFSLMSKIGNQIIGNLYGNVAALVVENYGNGQNENQIRCCNYMGFNHYARNCTNKARLWDSSYYTERLLLVKKEEVGLPLTAEEIYFLVVVTDEDE
nr:hypothetical protein [Tanacetum cinerariifolium]